MGFEWVMKYCDFEFFLKVDDDVFVNIFKLLNYLRKFDIFKIKLYFGNVV